MPKLIVLLFFVIIISGCPKQEDLQIKTEKADTHKTAPKTDTIKNETPGIFDGLYTVNIGLSLFRDCKYPDSVYWVIDETKKLQDQYKKILTSPSVYNSVVVSVRGELEETTDSDKKEKYPTTLRVKEILLMEKKNSENTCVNYDFWATGNDQPWTLDISEKENLIEFILPSENKTYYFFYDEPQEENGIITYKNYNPIQRYLIEVKIKKEKCLDAKTGKSYDYSAEVALSENRKYYGCAIKGKGKISALE